MPGGVPFFVGRAAPPPTLMTSPGGPPETEFPSRRSLGRGHPAPTVATCPVLPLNPGFRPYGPRAGDTPPPTLMTSPGGPPETEFPSRRSLGRGHPTPTVVTCPVLPLNPGFRPAGPWGGDTPPSAATCPGGPPETSSFGVSQGSGVFFSTEPWYDGENSQRGGSLWN